jgi:glycosyltransferase involved in cell wall biosynthesis
VKFAKYLPAEGWQPVIYTPENPELSSMDKTLLADIPAEAEIIRRPITEPYGLYRKLMGSKASTDMQTLIGGNKGADATGGEVNPISGGSKNWKQNLSLWIRGNLFIPDPRVWWVRPSVRFLKKYLKDHPVDVVVTTGPPQSMHLIGRGLHRATGIPWVADFRDPWTRMFYYKHLHLTKASDRKQHRLEKSVLDEASAVISVTPLVQREFQEMTRTPVVLITNGFDEDDYPAMGSHSGNLSEFRITHTGLFAEDGNPLVLWDALTAKCAEDEAFRSALRIRLVGKVDAAIVAAIEARGLGPCLDNLGYRPHDEAVAEQRAASLLILPLRQEPEYRNVLPGKIFEYLAAQRPVLGIGQEDGAAAQVLADTRTGVMCDWDNAAAIRSAVDRAWSAHLHPDSAPAFSPTGLDRYTRRHLTATLAALLNQLSVR